MIQLLNPLTTQMRPIAFQLELSQCLNFQIVIEYTYNVMRYFVETAAILSPIVQTHCIRKHQVSHTFFVFTWSFFNLYFNWAGQG